MTKIEAFAQKYRLRVRRDACGDQVIYGSVKSGESQLYFDGEALCLMVIDGPLINRSRWQALGGKLWLGDIARFGSRGVQDVKITDIPLAHAKLAIRLARVKRKREMSEAQLAVLAAARQKLNAPGKETTPAAQEAD